MSVLPILLFPDKRLRKIARPVKEINKKIESIIDNMFETMYDKEGIGLAGTQVNIHQQIVVIDISKNHEEPLVLINPKVIKKDGKLEIEEGCLSIPNYRAIVPRFKKIKICAFNQKGYLFELEATELLSVCIQHEIDHLFGILFIDYIYSSKNFFIHQLRNSHH